MKKCETCNKEDGYVALIYDSNEVDAVPSICLLCVDCFRTVQQRGVRINWKLRVQE